MVIKVAGSAKLIAFPFQKLTKFSESFMTLRVKNLILPYTEEIKKNHWYRIDDIVINKYQTNMIARGTTC